MAVINHIEVQQQTSHVCAYWAILNGVRALSKSDNVQDALPPKSMWRVDLPADEVDALLQDVLAHPSCNQVSESLFLVDQDMCLQQCNTIDFPSVRRAADAINRKHARAILLLVNLVSSQQVNCMSIRKRH